MPPEQEIELADQIDDNSGVIEGDPLEKAPVKEVIDNKPEPKLSVREAIKVAQKEQEDKANPQSKKDAPAKKVQADKSLQDKEDEAKPETDKAEKESATKVVDGTSSKYEAPKGWTKEAKAEFDRLPEVVKASIAKREDEASKGFKEYGDKTKQLEEYNNLISTYAPDLQQYGLTGPKAVERTFQWLRVISNPNKTQAALSIKELAASFGAEDELRKLYAPKEQSTTPVGGQPGYQEPANVDVEAIQTLKSKIDQLEGKFSVTEQQAAVDYVNNWAKDKPHFQKVRGVMKSLIQGNLVKSVDGKPDLDAAYDQACRLDTEIHAQMMADEVAKKEKELLDAQAAKKAKDAETVQKARRASVGLKPTAPIGNINTATKPKNTASVRDSISAALKEVHGT